MGFFSKQSDEISIVAIGSFNPAIFHPEWFLRHDLVAEEDLKEPYLELNVVHRELSQFKSSWFSIEVVSGRFILTSSDMSRAEDLRDLAANIFNILAETPVTALGFNKTSAYRCATVDAWHKVGYAIAPRDIWLAAIPDADREPGGVGMKMAEIEIKRWDELPGYYRVNVSPSNYPPNQEVSIRVNNHVQYGDLKETDKDDGISSFILKSWEESVINADRIMENLLKEVENAK